ncbi:hypothetical protein DH2020_023332 [Rehmannia glutinosa]|uniref:Uncharacterized protein n=1 Tax=Rehmannia glutinosa TaxID=99300 RepID=A0ABR0WA76_REHGL
MASTVPAKSQPLHNFTLPHLRWNKDGHSSGHHQRRRSIKSPSRRPTSSSASPIRQSPLRSVSATPPETPVSVARLYRAGVTASVSGSRGLLGETVSESRRIVYTVSGSRVGETLADRHDLASESEALGRGRGALVENRRNHSKNLKLDSIRRGVYLTNPERDTQKFETKSKAKEVDVAEIKRSKILIKIPYKNNKIEEENLQEEPLKIGNNDEADETDEVREEGKINNNIDEENKTWNLRPRKPIHRLLNVNGGTVKNNGLVMPEKHKGQSPLRNLNNRSGDNGGSCGSGDKKGGGEKKEKRKLSISVPLSKEEIEEDIFALTGSKPARRPKKRAKSIQKQLDSVFPGLWLVSITADSYKVSENHTKDFWPQIELNAIQEFVVDPMKETFKACVPNFSFKATPLSQSDVIQDWGPTGELISKDQSTLREPCRQDKTNNIKTTTRTSVNN